VEAKELVASAIARAQADLEEALSELDRMPAADAGSVAFAAHALNNYLTITEGTVELILMRLADHPDAQIRTWLEGVQHAARLMARTVSQLMNVSVNTEIALRFEEVELPGLVQRVCAFYQRLADRKAIRIVADSSGDVPPVWADRIAIAAALDNLLSNAIKYSQPGKQVRVRVQGEQGWAVCGVHDEGPGLSQEDQAKLFRRGIRLTPKPTGGEPQMGYGLAVAREFIERLGGQIWCESVLGQGSCFAFRLPACQERRPGSGAELPGPPAGGGVPGRTQRCT
jgi:signal transduction histidine kinase